MQANQNLAQYKMLSRQHRVGSWHFPDRFITDENFLNGGFPEKLLEPPAGATEELATDRFTLQEQEAELGR
jgi:hypothetical protein